MLTDLQIRHYHSDGFVTPDYRVPDTVLADIRDTHHSLLSRLFCKVDGLCRFLWWAESGCAFSAVSGTLVQKQHHTRHLVGWLWRAQNAFQDGNWWKRWSLVGGGGWLVVSMLVGQVLSSFLSPYFSTQFSKENEINMVKVDLCFIEVMNILGTCLVKLHREWAKF